MKNFLKIFFLISIFSLVIVGCGIKNADNIIDKIRDKIEKSNSYYVEGTMEIINNEDTYTYDVTVSYKKDDYYKIDLVNTLNNHEQVILRNDDGVYVVTPSLNKSFKFQSDWPYNNSQIYLLSSIMEDLSEDEDRLFKTKDNGYYFQSSVNYPNNKSLVKQNVYVDSKMKITKVEVVDDEGNVQISMKFDKIEYNKDFDKDYFELSNLISVNKKKDTSDTKEEDTTNNSTSNSSNDNKDSSNENSSNDNNSIDGSKNGSNSDVNNQSDNNANDTQNNTSTDTNSTVDENKTKETATIDDVIYPMYLPANTTLANKEVIDTEDGQRLILTFSGDNPFVLVEETISYQEEGLIIPVSGSLDFLTDVIGVINDRSVSWESNGIGYYIASNKLDSSELINIARSISVLPVSK